MLPLQAARLDKNMFAINQMILFDVELRDENYYIF